MPACPARVPGSTVQTALPAPPCRCREHHGLPEIAPGLLKVAFVSFPGVCAKGKGKSFFPTQDPLFELFLDREFVKDGPSLPPGDSRGQCSLNLEEDQRAAGDTASNSHRPDAVSGPNGQALQGQLLALPPGSPKPLEGAAPAHPIALGTEDRRQELKEDARLALGLFLSQSCSSKTAKEGISLTFFSDFEERLLSSQPQHLLGKISMNETCNVGDSGWVFCPFSG